MLQSHGGNMNLKDLKNIFSHNSLSSDQLADLIETLSKYPFFQALRMVYITNMKSVSDINSNAIFIPDRRFLYNLLYNERYFCQTDSEVEDNKDDRTVKLIDSFLDGYDCNNEIACDVPNDYMAYMASEDKKDEDHVSLNNEHELLSSFVNRDKSIQPGDNGDYSLEEENIDDVCFTETLANIYIKQERYDKAIEIIRKLSLKYPKKNIYFADQLKTLEKLIINNKSDNKKCTYS